MKVLITTDTYYPMINGVVTSINNLYRDLKNQGHEVKIMTLSSDSKEGIDGDIYYLKSFKIGIYPDARFRVPFTRGLIRKILEWKPDIIHSQTEFSTFFAAKYIAKRAAIPHIHTYHTLYEDYLMYLMNGKLISKNANEKITKYLFNRLDAVIVPTKKVEKILGNYGVNTNTYIVPTGIDLARFKKKVSLEEKKLILEKLNLTEKDKVIAFIGRIAEEKNIEEIIEYFASAKDKIENLKFMVVGGGPYLEKLEEKARKLNVMPYIRFVGMIDHKDVYKYYQVGQVFVTASTSETQGLTYVEALASGLPVVCRYDSCVDGLVIDNKTGFAYKNVDEFTAYLKKVFSNDIFMQKLRYEAVKKAEEYSIENFGEKVSDIYVRTYNNYNNVMAEEVTIRRFLRHAIVKR